MSVSTLELREEELESWDHPVSHELVYFCDIPDPDLERRSRFVGWPAEYKLGRAWLEVHFVLGGEREMKFNAIVKIDRLHRNVGVNLQLGATDRHRGVFVDIAQFVQLPKGVSLEVIPSLVRLKRLDDLDCLAGDVPRNTPEPLLAPLRPVPVNGEGCFTGRGATAQQSELPSELIQPRPQVVGELSDQQRDLVGDARLLKADDMESLFRIILFRYGNVLTPKKQPDFPLKSLEVFFRPQGFYAGVG